MSDTPQKAPPKTASEAERTFIGPPVLAAPSAEDTSESNAVVLFPLPLEFLCVRVTFHRVAAAGLEVRFVTLDGAEVEGGLKTDLQGRVMATRRVTLGAYVCEIERQVSARVYTVPSLDRGFPVTLPVGRFYKDLHEREEFATPQPKPSSARIRGGR